MKFKKKKTKENFMRSQWGLKSIINKITIVKIWLIFNLFLLDFQKLENKDEKFISTAFEKLMSSTFIDDKKTKFEKSPVQPSCDAREKVKDEQFILFI